MQSHIFGSHSVTNGWVTMYDKNKIEEIFKTLGLESKEKRKSFYPKALSVKPIVNQSTVLS
jgi:hypothetical protein